MFYTLEPRSFPCRRGNWKRQGVKDCLGKRTTALHHAEDTCVVVKDCLNISRTVQMVIRLIWKRRLPRIRPKHILQKASKSIDFPQFGTVHPRSMQAVKQIVRMEATFLIKQGVFTIPPSTNLVYQYLPRI